MKKVMKTILNISLLLCSVVLFSQTTINYPLGSGSGSGGTANIFLGQNTGLATTGNSNIFVGPYAGEINNSGEYNSFIGHNNGKNNIIGSRNVFLGALSGVNSTTSNNVFLGFSSGNKNSTGYNNVFLGASSGFNNTTGSENIFLGFNSGKNSTTGAENVFLGASSGLSDTTGSRNVFLGRSSGQNNKQGSQNVFIGMNAGKNTNLAYENVFMGYRSGFNHQQGSRNTFLGAYTGQNSITGKDNVFIGYKSGIHELGDNKLYIANSDTNSPLIYGDFSTNDVKINGELNITENLGIGITTVPASYKLAVAGNIITEEVKVKLQSSGWPDFVFEEKYKLPTLSEVEAHINKKGHLQNIPSAAEVKENGVLLGDMNAKLLQKIEELTLYTIEQEKEIRSLKKMNSKILELQVRLEKIESQN